MLPVNVSEPMITSSPISTMPNLVTCGAPHVIFSDADHRGGERAKSVAERGSLRHGGHVDHAERNSDAGADDQRDDDPLVLDDSGLQSVAPTASAAQFRPPALRAWHLQAS